MSFKGAKHYFLKVYKCVSMMATLGFWLVHGCRNRKTLDQQKQRSVGLSTLQWGKLYLPSHFVKAPSQMHVWLGRQLDTLHLARGTKLNVIGPRGGAKSTIGTLCYVLRAAVEGWEPYIWVISDTRTQAQMHLDNIREELESNLWLAEDFPKARLKKRGGGGNRIRLTNGTVIESYGTGQKVRGRRWRDSRPSLIVCDDLQNDGHIQSAHQRSVSRHWFHSALVEAGNTETNIINLATALHREALAMELDRTPGWKSARFQSIEVWPTNMPMWREWEEIYCDLKNERATEEARQFFERHRSEMELGAEVLWPDEEDLYTLMKMRVENGHTAFEREKQNSPVDPESCEWPDEYFGDHIWFEQWPRDLQFKTIALDPSKGRDARRGDYSAFVVLGADAKGVLYVEADLARRDTARIVADGVELCRRHQASAFGVEANQFQELLADQFVSEFENAGLFECVPAAIHNHANKLVRIRRLGPFLSQRRMRFLSGNPSTLLLVDQMRDFPCGSHDDGPDALEMALRLAEEMIHGKSIDDGLGDRLVVGE